MVFSLCRNTQGQRHRACRQKQVDCYGYRFRVPQSHHVCIRTRGGRQFELLGEINPQLLHHRGVAFYKYVNKWVVKKSDQEVQDEIGALPIPYIEPTTKEMIAALTQLVVDMSDKITKLEEEVYGK